MKKWLAIGSLVVSMSYVGSSFAIEPVSSSEMTVGAAIAAGVGTVAASSVVVGAAGGVGTAYYINDKMFTNCSDGQEACDAAQLGTYTGAGLGTLWGVACLAAEGANLVGLASIGSMVGGGVAAGAVTVVAAPIIAAAAIGGATYWVVKDWNSISSLWSEDIVPKIEETVSETVTPLENIVTPAP